MLKLSNLKISANEKEIIKNINLEISDGEIHVLMGKNGIGKSSIAKSIIGLGGYNVSGNIIYNNEDITNISISERAKKGIYLINQSPIQIEGVTNAEMLRLALSEKTSGRVNIFEFNKELEKICEKLELDKKFIHQEINVGCSGGERKKIELMHMCILKPSLIILDEIDSGLDVDAIKLVTNIIKEYHKDYNPAIIIITHSKALINSFDNLFVHIIDNGEIVKSGTKKLAEEILDLGFRNISSTNVMSEN